MIKTVKFFAGFMFFVSVLFAASDFPIVEFPTWVVNPTDTVWIRWVNPVGMSESEAVGNRVYFSRTPGGADFNNYGGEITAFRQGGLTSIRFIPSQNPDFRPGINYVIIGNKDNKKTSNEVKIILKHTEQNTNMRPSGGFIDNTTPQFSWTKPAGVPYSHIVLSDEEVQLGSDGKISLETISGVSMIWQAITANTRINYGEPDPSGVFKTAPPPLSPGKRYTWLVFNNYGNNPAYTPVNDMVLPAAFEIKGTPKMIPKNISPVSKDTIDLTEIKNTDNGGRIDFKWSNLDTDASIYRVFVYSNTNMAGIEAQVVVWSGEITAGQFRKPNGTMMDTATLSMSAKDVLSRNAYSWRVVAIYKDGSGQSGDLSRFKYNAPTGTIEINTLEEIEANGTKFTQNLSGAEIEMEVLNGSLEETMLFFTDANGWAERDRAVGTSKITAKKAGYESENRIITISENKTETISITLRRPVPSIFGRIIDTLKNPVDLATITAISDNGDTVVATSSPDGSFIMNCQPESWTLSVSKQGFLTSSGIRVILPRGSISNQKDILLKRNQLVFSGTIRNSERQPVTGAAVRVFSADRNTEIASLLSTPSNGRFSFPLFPGNYIISAEKPGLYTPDISLQFSASQDREIVLQGGAAMLKGTLRGISWIENTQMEAAVTNAKIEIRNAATKAVVATSTTDKTYGTYNISVPASPAKYLLRFTAEGFDTTWDSTASAIVGGNTYQQDFKIKSFASISGTVRDEDGNMINGVSISLIKNGQAAATSITDNGNFTFFRIANGNYTISANGNGYTKKSVTPGDLITAKDGRFFIGETPISSINIITEPANGTMLLAAKTTPAATDPNVAIIVYSPLVHKLDKDGILSGISADPSIKYFVRAASANTNIIDCVEKAVSFSGTNEIKDTILMPFAYIPNTDAATEKITLKVSAWKTADAAFVYYRHRGETEFIKSETEGTISANEISFAVTPKNPGSDIEFYFDIFTNDAKYSNKTRPFTKFVAANDKKITRWELLPATGNITLALKGRINIMVKAYFGANFTEITDLKTSDFTWTLKTNNASRSLDDKSVSAIITGNKAGVDTLVVSINSSAFSKADGVPASISLPITITDSEISSIKAILLSDFERPEYMMNRETAIFGVEARDKKGNLVYAMPQWIVNPQNAGTINPQTGVFTPKADFIGRVHIVAQVNSRVRDEFVYDGEKGMLVAYLVNQNGGTVGDGTAELDFKANANAIIISLDKPNIKNSAQRDVEEIGVFIISDIFEIRRQLGESFVPASTYETRAATTNDLVTVKLFVPQIYHKNLKNGQRDEEKLDIAIWDSENLRWTYFSRSPNDASDTTNLTLIRPTYDPTEKSISVGLAENLNKYNNIRLGIIAKGLEADTEISVSPNPFSPFVSPMNDYLHITEMHGDVKGTCIKITPKSNKTKFKPSAQVGIFTADGTPVYRATLNGLDAGQSYYLFWDGRTQLSQTALNAVDIIPNKAIFVKGDEMCRNGRYFVNVTIDNGKDKKRYTKEIILFK